MNSKQKNSISKSHSYDGLENKENRTTQEPSLNKYQKQQMILEKSLISSDLDKEKQKSSFGLALVKSKTPRLKISANSDSQQQLKNDELAQGLKDQALLEYQQRGLNTARSAYKDNKSPRQNLFLRKDRQQTEYSEKLQKSYSSKSGVKSQDSMSNKEIKHSFRLQDSKCVSKHVKNAKSTPINEVLIPKVIDDSARKIAISHVRTGSSKTIQPRQQTRYGFIINKQNNTTLNARPSSSTKILQKSKSPTKKEDSAHKTLSFLCIPELQQKEEFLSCLGNSDVIKNSIRKLILTASQKKNQQSFHTSNSLNHRSSRITERKSQHAALKKKQSLLFQEKSIKTTNSVLPSAAGETLYYTAKETSFSNDEDLRCDEELVITDEANHQQSQEFSYKISKMEYESSSKKYKPELDIIQTAEDEEEKEQNSNKKKLSKLSPNSKYATFGPTTASSKFEQQFGFNALFHAKTSDFNALFSEAKKSLAQNNQENSDSSDQTEIEDFTYENDPTIVFDEHNSFNNAEAALISQRSASKSNKSGLKQICSKENLQSTNKAIKSSIDHAPNQQLHQCQQVNKTYHTNMKQSKMGALLKSSYSLLRKTQLSSKHLSEQRYKSSVSFPFFEHSQNASSLAFRRREVRGSGECFAKQINFLQVPQKEVSMTNSLLMPTQSPQSTKSNIEKQQMITDEEQTQSYELAKLQAFREIPQKTSSFLPIDFQNKSSSPYSTDSPFRGLYQHDMSQEELVSDIDKVDNISDFDYKRHSDSLISGVAQEISQLQISRDFAPVKQDSTVRQIIYEKQATQSHVQINTQVSPHTDLHRLHLIQTIQSLVYLSQISQQNIDEAESFLQKIDLPEPLRPEQTKTLLFDLDETLAHCTANDPELQCSQSQQIWVTMEQVNDEGKIVIEDIPVFINLRPHINECLLKCSEKYQIGVFTASSQDYADAVIDLIDPNRTLIQFRLYRQHCFQTSDGHFIKDLRVIRNRDLKDILLVDNSVHSFGFQLDNGVPIIPFYNDQKDQELIHLASYVVSRSIGEDLRPQNASTFQLRELQQADLHSALLQFSKDDLQLKEQKKSACSCRETQEIDPFEEMEDSPQCQCCSNNRLFTENNNDQDQYQSFITSRQRNFNEHAPINQRAFQKGRNETINEESFEESVASEQLESQDTPERKEFKAPTDLGEITEMVASSWEPLNRTRTSEKQINDDINIQADKKASGHGHSKSQDCQFLIKQMSVTKEEIMSLNIVNSNVKMDNSCFGQEVQRSETNSLASGSELDQEAIKALAKRLDFRQIENSSLFKKDMVTCNFDSFNCTDMAAQLVQSAVNDVVIVETKTKTCSLVMQESSSSRSNGSQSVDVTPASKTLAISGTNGASNLF